MKQVSTTKRSAFALILIAVMLLFTVVGFASGEETDTSATVTDGMKVIKTYLHRGMEELEGANYIGTYCAKAFDALRNIRAYWWIILGVVALIECFFGYRIFRVELAILGLVVGFVFGLMLFPQLVKLIPQMGETPFVETIIAGIIGLAGLLLTQFFFKAAVTIGAGYLGYIYSTPYVEKLGNVMLCRILIGIGVAILVFLLLKFFVVLATSLLGGAIALSQLTLKISAIQKPILAGNTIIDKIFGITSKLGLGLDALTIALIIGLVVGILGFIFQFANTRKKRL